jgi:hypothetical protein
LITVPAILPVVRVLAAPAVRVPATLALKELFGVVAVGLQLSLANHLILLLAVVVLGHDLEFMVLPLRHGIGLDELLGCLLISKGDEDGALEEILVSTTELQALNLTKGGEEALKVELSIRGLVTEALHVDCSSLCLGLGRRHGLVGHLSLDKLLALLALNLQDLAVAQRSDHGAIWLEASHALERVNFLDGDGLVFGTAARLPHELVLRVIPVSKVEFDLCRELKHQ